MIQVDDFVEFTLRAVHHCGVVTQTDVPCGPGLICRVEVMGVGEMLVGLRELHKVE